MTLIITKKNGQSYNLSELGIRVVEFEPESLNVVNDISKIGGGAYVVSGNGYDARFINVMLQVRGSDITDYAMQRSEVFSLFSTTEEFSVVDEKEPFKRWYVKSEGNFTMSRNVKSGTFYLVLICTKPYAESVFSTLELNNYLEWDSNQISWGEGYDYDNEKTLNYSFYSNQFSIENMGNAEIDPAISKLNITFNGVGNNVEIRNVTNGTIYRLDTTINANDTVEINGIRSFKNGVSVFRQTNKKLLTLSPGKNDIIVSGVIISEIKFDFNFQYK